MFVSSLNMITFVKLLVLIMPAMELKVFIQLLIMFLIELKIEKKN